MMQILIEHRKKIYDISGLVTKLTFEESLNEGAVCLKFSYLRENLIFDNGDSIRVMKKANEGGVFIGRIFKVEVSENNEINVTSYDNLRYLKNKDIVVFENMTVSEMVKETARKLQLQTGQLDESKIKLETVARYDKTYLDIICEAIKDTEVKSGSSKYYSLRDNFGKVELREISSLVLPLVIGDNSLLTSYNYSKSIDDEVYNAVKLLYQDESKGKLEIAFESDKENLDKWGILQYFEKTDKANAKDRAKNLLKLYNKEIESLKLTCIGDLRIRAGNILYINIGGLKLDKRVLVKKVSHDLLPIHTMTIEVELHG